MRMLILVSSALFASTQADATQAWTCDYPTPGKWEVVKGKLISPLGDLAPVRDVIPVVKNTPEALIAMSNPTKSGRFELVTIHKITGHMKIVGLGLEGQYEDHFEGKCSPLN